MNEFEYDCYQRKLLARQAKYRKNGSKSKMCTLPQDRMTDAQLKKQNSKVVSFMLDKPMRSWTDFQRLRRASAVEYINTLHATYGASVGDLAKMFGVSYNTMWSAMKTLGISFKHTGRKSNDRKEAWEKFLAGPAEEVPTTESEEVIEPEEKEAPEQPVIDEPPTPEPSKSTMQFQQFSMRFGGDIQLDTVMNSLRLILGSGANGTLTVEFIARE